MKRFTALMCLPLVLMSCTTVRETLGGNKAPPDEFSVVERAPLTVPPDFNLAPPQPGAPRPQETQATAKAESLVIGQPPVAASKNMSPVEKALLSQVGANNAKADIRQELSGPDDEHSSDGSLTQRLGLSSGEAGKALDPSQESKRLQKNKINTPNVPDPKAAQ